MRVDEKAGNGRGRYCCCSPRHGMPSNSRNEGSERLSMTWRALSGGPYLAATTKGLLARDSNDSVASGAGAAAAAGAAGDRVTSRSWQGAALRVRVRVRVRAPARLNLTCSLCTTAYQRTRAHSPHPGLVTNTPTDGEMRVGSDPGRRSEAAGDDGDVCMLPPVTGDAYKLIIPTKREANNQSINSQSKWDNIRNFTKARNYTPLIIKVGRCRLKG